jgi:ATP-dependent exoDNAse (exonuclease V) beta subunit
VHRLFQFWGDRGAPADCGTPDPVALAATLLTAEERTSLENPGEIAGRAVDAWEKIRTRGEVVELLAAGTVLHEVPFSMTLQSEDGPIVLRGAIDCLVARTDGSVAVVEFKTGRPHPVHEEQLAVYVRAAQSLFPGVPVEGHLVYP